MAKKKASLALPWAFYHTFLPFTLVAAVIFRYNLLSAIYLVFLLVFPYAPSLRRSTKGKCIRFTVALLVVSTLFTAAQVAFQIALLIKSPYGSLVGDYCSYNEKLARYIGFERLDKMDVGNIFRVLLPDVLCFTVAVCTFFTLKKIDNTAGTVQKPQESFRRLSVTATTSVDQGNTMVESSSDDEKEKLAFNISATRIKNGSLLLFTAIFLALAGIAEPSLVSAAYLVVFISMATTWAFHGRLLVKSVMVLRVLLSFVTAIQLMANYIYQIELFYAALPPTTLVARLLGLIQIFETDCAAPYRLQFYSPLKWTAFASPVVIFILHWLLAAGVRLFFISDKNKLHPRKEIYRKRRRHKMDDKMIDDSKHKNLNAEDDINLQPLVSTEEKPAGYGAAVAGTSNEMQEAHEMGKSSKTTKTNPQHDGFIGYAAMVMTSLEHQSFYVAALIIMMAWSVTYNSWLTFVLLVWSCVLWLVKERSWATLCCSPVFTLYAIALVLLQYVYSLNLTDTELPTNVTQKGGKVLLLSDFGCVKYYYPCLHLGAQILYMCVFWLVLHQFVFIRKHRGEQSTENVTPWVKTFSNFCFNMLCKYWILLVYAFAFAVCMEGRPSGIKILYTVIIFLNALCYEFSWLVWKRTLSLFLMVLVVYTMLVVLVIYTFQFSEFPNYWKSFTNFTDEQLADLGLVKYPTSGELFIHIFVPTLFLLVVILEKHYFLEAFLKKVHSRVRPAAEENELSTSENNETTALKKASPKHEATPEDGEEEKKESTFGAKVTHCFKCMWYGILNAWYYLVRIAWKLLEFHIWKWMAVSILLAAVYNVSALLGVLFIIWLLLLPVRVLHGLLYFMTCVYVWLIVLAAMFFQLNFINDIRVANNQTNNCTFDFYNGTFTYTGNVLNWVGFEKMDSTGRQEFFYHALPYMAIVIMLALERTVVRRMEWRRKYNSEQQFPMTAVYTDITWKEADQGLIPCVKFLINYWFYKMGVEACYVMAAITIWVRMDVYATIYAILLIAALFIKTRNGLKTYFGFYAILLMLLLLWQFMSALGMPSVWCQNHEYPWTVLPHTNEIIRNRLIRWVYLPDFVIPPLGYYMAADIFQLIFVLCQVHVFNSENSNVCVNHAGENRYITGKELDQITPENNPKANYMDRQSQNLLDQVKIGIFKYSFWLTAAIIFIAGTSRISLFCMGYFVAFFYLMSFNQQLLMGKPSRLLRIWNFVLGYNVAVITLKVSLQIASCVYIDILNEKACIFVQLFSLGCANPSDYYELTIDTVNGQCAVPDNYTNSGVTMDFVCFFFLVFQRRIFSTCYFRHAANDMKISLKLASRGAQLFEEKLIDEVTKIRDDDSKGLAQIKESILKVQQKYLNLLEGEPPKYHTQAIRAGDYYMFQDVDYQRHLLHRGHKEPEKSDTLQLEEQKDKDSDKDKEEKSEDLQDGGMQTKEDVQQLTKDVEQTNEDEEDEEPKSNIVIRLFRATVRTIVKGIDWISLTLNTINCDYRNIELRLANEKELLIKENIKHLRDKREAGETNIVIEEIGETSDDIDSAEKVLTVNGSSSTSLVVTDKEWPEWQDLKPEEFDCNQRVLIRFFYALWYTAISRTEFLCYFLIILNLMLSASIISLVLPIAVYLWATLSVPRPSSRFWMFCIYYTEVILIIKFLFQFEFFPWNVDEEANLKVNDPFWWPRIIGIEQKSMWSALDLASLLAFFFHRSILKTHGTWDHHGNCEDKDEKSEDDKTIETCSEPQNEESKTVAVVEGSSSKDIVTDESGETSSTEVEEVPTDFKTKVKSVVTAPYLFVIALLNQEFNAVVDIYIYMFLCDVINFIIIIFGYWAFGKYSTTKDDVVSNITSNKVPSGFLAMLLIQFSMMMIDRAIYLRKNVAGKLVFQVVLVIGVHVWMFFILPAINERPFYMNGVAQAWYFFKFIYFLLSAYQIRCGYPSRVLGNFLTKAYGTPNLFLFKGYRAIPFLVELTAIMDWMFIETTMGIGEWMKFHSVYAEVFELKCWREFERNYPGPRGQPKGHVVKYLVGGLLVFLLIAVIWFPLLFMNLALTIGGVLNNPTHVSVEITCGTYEPLFQITVDAEYMQRFTTSQFDDFSKNFSADPVSAQFLSQFTAPQVVSVKINGTSKTSWVVSPPQRENFMNRVNPDNPLNIDLTFDWKIERDPEKTTVSTASGLNKIVLTSTDPARKQLYDVLSGNSSTPYARILDFYPKYIYSSASSKSTAATKLYPDGTKSYVDVDLDLLTQSGVSWWTVSEAKQEANSSAGIEIIVFSDKVSPSSLSFLANYGIIGLYISVVLVVGKLVRGIFGSATSSIMFQELPNVDKIDQLCLDIFLVREEEYFDLEEDLFAKLLFLYRSPATLIEWTRPKRD